jgi:UDP-glucuronate decarboxylase
MESPEDFTGPVNLGNPVETTMADLARRILDLTGSKSTLEFKPLPEDDPRKRLPDITLAREQLGWEPVVLLEEGLKRTIAYFEERLLGAGG